MTQTTYRARWAGTDYEAAPDLVDGRLWMRLYGAAPAEGFERIAPGRFVRTVPAADCSAIWHVTVVCEWQGAPFLVHTTRETQLLIEYTGGDVLQAMSLGVERVERGVYRLWVRRDEVTAMSEKAVSIRRM
ncbi:hypothetical protein ACIBQ1_34315 [Nonomuraea sp. NPDC050153]|uniref:hypothetical protein n=1 Tax=Nonomuraea sp. NPDC050153 TaxID=3364359 RepID=UPI0037A54418